ncbi:helix-turn-helix domain-containing protein [Pedobacter sp. ASV12]|uniref:helix-turn-helix domain-containing protein n=1 Tax=Pedobacter sp. ASV12 TaxID=2795120 RepID=UPI0018EA4EE5|nr:helix-turn-helix domain-containing protein [Pedobacter sp. ASV12]
MKPRLPIKCLLLLLLLAQCFVSTANNPQETKDKQFNETYTKIATEIASSDIKKALKMSDSLLLTAHDDYHKMKCLMLLATLYQRSGNFAKALVCAADAEKLAPDDEKGNAFKVRIAGFLSTLYRDVNLTEQARKYLEIAETTNSKLQKSPATTISQALILQEKAYYAIEEDRDYKLGLQQLAQAEKGFLEVQDQASKNVFLATNDQLSGLCYFNLKNYAKAKVSLLNAITRLGSTESELKAFIYCGLGDVELAEKRYQEALSNYKLAESYAQRSNNSNAKIGLSKSMANYYSVIGDAKTALVYQNAYSNLSDERAAATKKISNQLLAELKEKETGSNRLTLLLTGASALLLVALIVMWLFKNKKEKENRFRYEQLIKKMEALQQADKTPAHSLLPKAEHSELMSKESEDRLREGLAKLEEKHFFLQGDISLSGLASELNSNTRYVSYIINKYQEKDFNNYINALRIDYALNDLRTNPMVRKYKIAYLAQKYGFSSHSKFGAIFKGITGISPSVFIENLNKDDKEKRIQRVTQEAS